MNSKASRAAMFALALCSALLCGCGSITRFVPDMSTRQSSVVHLEGANGPLSAQQSRAILDKLKGDDHGITSFQRHMALEEAIVGSPLVAGNKITLLQDGAATYPAMLAAIKAARVSINMESYIFDDDKVGKEFVAALLERLHAGVQINLVYDSVGAMATPREFFKDLKDAGIHVLEYNPVNPLHLRKGWDIDQRDHRKMLVVDGKVAFIGGINISGVYSSGSAAPKKKKPAAADAAPWRDTQLRMEGPVVKDFQKLYMDTWSSQKGPAQTDVDFFPQLASQGPEVVRAIGSSPDEPYSLMYSALLAAIENADSQILLTNAYFVPDPVLLDALIDAARRGVDVKLLLPGMTDSALVFHASRSFYDQLLRAGVKIYERQNRVLHAKTAVIDGVWSTVGSTNLDWRSHVHNQEVNAVILGPEFGTQMQKMFDDDLTLSRQVTLQDWRHRPVGARLKEFGARLWARVL